MGYQEEFINSIAPHIVAWRDYLGYGVASAIIAQACLESAYGRSNKAVNYHNYFGLKYKEGRVSCNNGYFTDTSLEQLPDGTYITITTKWFSFPDTHTGVKGYYQFVNYPKYDIKYCEDPLSYLQALKDGGYATSQKYVDNCMAIVNKYNLTQFDNGGAKVKPDSQLAQGIIVSPTTYGKRSKLPDTITIHHMGCFPSPSAKNQCERFASKSRRASATYCIGNDGTIWQGLPECYAPCTSSNKTNDMRAVTIEVANSSGAPDWKISDKAFNSLVALCADICKRNNIKALIWSDNKKDRVNHVNGCNLNKHKDFSATKCPGSYIENLEKGGALAALINQYIDKGSYILYGYDYSPVFDPVYYSDHYIDLKNAFGDNAQALWNHFCAYGMNELRKASEEFDPIYYMNAYKDLKEAYGNNYPMYYFHYVAFGKAEGRKARA